MGQIEEPLPFSVMRETFRHYDHATKKHHMDWAAYSRSLEMVVEAQRYRIFNLEGGGTSQPEHPVCTYRVVAIQPGGWVIQRWEGGQDPDELMAMAKRVSPPDAVLLLSRRDLIEPGMHWSRWYVVRMEIPE